MKKLLSDSQREYSLRAASFVLTLLGMWFLYRFSAKEVFLLADGDPQNFRTHARTVGEFFDDVDLAIQPEDRLNYSTSDPVVDQMTLQLERAQEVKLLVGGKTRLIRSVSKTPSNILADAGIRLFPGDSTWVNGVIPSPADEALESSPDFIRVESGRSFDVLVDGELQRHRASGGSVGQALLEVGLILFEGDRVEPDLEARLEPGMQVTINRARPVVILRGDKQFPIQSAASGVGEMMIAAGFSISGLDYSVPAPEEPIPADGVVRVVHVEEDVLVELEPLPFETVYQPLETLELDTLQVQSPGTFGAIAERVRIRYEDGEEVDRTLEEAVTVVEPEPRVIGYGTKIVVRSMNTGYGTIEYWRAIPVYATSYSPCRLGVDRCGFVTAAGTGVDRGTIGVIRSWFNLMRGWSVFVPGYGPGSIQDIGAGFSDRDWVDLGFTDEEYEAWHDWTTLYFLTPVPPLDQIPWILP